MKEILETIITNLVDKKDSVSITEKKENNKTILEVKLAEEDMGKVIGKQGRIAKAIRTIIKSLAGKEKVIVEFID